MSGKKRAKSRKKTPSKTPSRKGKNGGRLLSGNPGNKGGGRPPNWLKEFCDEALADPKTTKVVLEILHDSEHPAVVAMWKAVADRAHGRPMQSVTHDVGKTLEEILTASFSNSPKEG